MKGFLSKKKSDIYSIFSNMQSSLKSAFSTIKEELDDHREAINENSNEISTNYEYLLKIETKLDKMSERLDNMEMLFKESNLIDSKIILSKEEQNVFVLLYTANEALSSKNIAIKLNLDQRTVFKIVNSLVDKGVDMIHEFRDRQAFIKLDSVFKEKHAKKNLVKIDLSSINLDYQEFEDSTSVARE